MGSPIKVSGLSVNNWDGKFEKALRMFGKKVHNDGLIRSLRAREFYEKPTAVTKRKRAAAKQRERKRVYEDSLKGGTDK